MGLGYPGSLTKRLKNFSELTEHEALRNAYLADV